MMALGLPQGPGPAVSRRARIPLPPLRSFANRPPDPRSPPAPRPELKYSAAQLKLLRTQLLSAACSWLAAVSRWPAAGPACMPWRSLVSPSRIRDLSVARGTPSMMAISG
jgi:hypothetical protein